MLTVLIFDDDVRSIAHIHSLVEEAKPAGTAFDILHATSVAQLEEILSDGRTHIDILIADVTTPEGQPSGIEVVQRYFGPPRGTQVIFVSGYLENALDVYDTGHVYFLLKPIDPARLAQALQQAVTRLSRRTPVMLHIKSDYHDRLINVAQILYIESHAHLAMVHCLSNTYQTYAKLDDLQKQLPSTFSRCHRSFVINLAYVSSLESNEVILHDGTHLPVSRRHARQVQKDLLAHLAAQG